MGVEFTTGAQLLDQLLVDVKTNRVIFKLAVAAVKIM